MSQRPGGERSEWSPEEMLLRVAWFYYKDDLTQDEIARRLSVSRASVGRMLDRARRTGLVTIQLNSEHLDAMELSGRLRRTFGLAEALVVPHLGGNHDGADEISRRVGLGGAQVLTNHLRRGLTVGIGFGRTVSNLVSATNFSPAEPVHLVTLTGGVAAYLNPMTTSRGDLNDATRASVIPSPIVTSTPALSKALTAELPVQSVLQLARGADIAVVGVGTATPDATIAEMGYLTPEDILELRDRQAVGDILGQYFDESGAIIDAAIHARRVGINLSELKSVPLVIGVAGGESKAHAILGALRGGYLDVLVTDETAALRLLDLQGASALEPSESVLAS